MKIAMKRFFIAIMLGIVGVLLASAALAAEPNNQACLGKDFSGYAKNGGSLFGEGGSEFGSFFSTVLAVGGAGAEVQAYLAGGIPDELLPNSCND
jgi:pectate lyase